MSTQALKEEMRQRPAGVFANYYYKYLGYREDLCAPAVKARANAVYTLFARAGAYVYRNDLIAGSIRPLWCEKSEAELRYARSIADSFGERTFWHNADHFSPDYGSVVCDGIAGMLRKIEISKAVHAGDAAKSSYLAAMQKTLEGFKNLLLSYAAEAETLQGCEGYFGDRLKRIAGNCRKLAYDAPETFEEALQLVWMCHIGFLMEGRAAMALGRMDQYLFPFYERDIKRGALTRGQAVELLENVFMKIYESRAYKDGDDVVNICIGGTDLAGKCEVNDLSYCILEAVKNCNVPGPNLSARVSSQTPDDFLDACLRVIGTGLGYPALMNDEVNIAALRRYGYEEADAYDYSMVGCIENFITGRQPPWSDGRFDTPRFFEYLFNEGRGIVHPSMGVNTGPVREISCMEDFLRKFREQLEYGAQEYYAFFNNENCRYSPARYPQPFLSCFCRDCIARAQDILEGGSKYPSVHGAALMGVGTVCDSLAAVEKVVFTDGAATLEELRDALAANFEGYEDLRKKLLAAPKYGNNDDFADKYAIWFVDTLFAIFSKFRTRDGGAFYIAMAANVSNIAAGKIIAATPDGRRAGEPLSDAASPTYGRDVRGATATLNSVSKPDYTKVACGTVLNQKFSPSMFEGEKRKKLSALLRVYFQKGGQEMQVNATSREVLKDAMAHPENYPQLVVRVSGFSALFVTLDRDVQEDILRLTQPG